MDSQAMRGLLIAVLYCVVSLTLADVTASLVVGAGLVNAGGHDLVLAAVMMVLFGIYLVIAPRWLNGPSGSDKRGGT